MKFKLGWIWATAFLGFWGYVAGTVDSLPVGRLATHFDLAGKPNGFMDKQGHLLFFGLASLGVNLLLLALFRWIDRVPEAFVNITHKDYWFSTPERKTEAFRRLRNVLCLSGVFLNVDFLLCHQMVVQANNPVFSPRFPANGLLAFLLALLVLFLLTVFRMVKPPAHPG